MNALLLALVLSGNVDALTKTTLDRVSFKAPKAWSATDEEGGKTWAAPGNDASLAVSVYAVDPVRPSKACVKQLVEAVGADGFVDLRVGKQPAARKVTTDFVGESEDAEKSDDNKVTTTTYLGCDGRTKWVLTFTAKTKLGPRFGPILKRVIDSLAYGK